MREMTRAQKIRAFNESNAPFYLVDHTDEVSLCCVFHPMPDSVFSLGQEAFNRYIFRTGARKSECTVCREERDSGWHYDEISSKGS